MGAAYRALAALPAFRHHVAAEAHDDPLFFLGNRHYLARGLSPPARMDAALTHYNAEERRRGTAYFEAVYRQGGLVLWDHAAGDHRYNITLCPGSDVAYEGGLSLVLHVDGGRVCVLSFSVVPSTIVLPGHKIPALHETILFITRKQLAQDRTYQTAFNKAFHRCTPAHMVLGALAGFAAVQGQGHALGIAAERHPSCTPEAEPRFQRAYNDFWLSVSGQRLSPLGYLIDLPPRLSPIEGMDAAHRRRAFARRKHIDEVQHITTQRLAASLAPPA